MTTSLSVEQLIERQVKRWQLLKQRESAPKKVRTVTISREPGSGGGILAAKLAQSLGWDLLNKEVLHAIAKSAKVRDQVLETLDERGISTLEDLVSSVIKQRHLWPDEYLRHLLKVVNAIGRHGNAVLVGRGANFILPPEKRFRVRVVAPLDFRVQRVAKTYGVPADEARNRILKTESERRAFIRKHFHQSATDLAHYDLIINTKYISLDLGANCVKAAMGL